MTLHFCASDIEVLTHWRQMTRKSKKESECRYVERVRTLLTDFPAGSVTSHESPDFIVDTGQRLIGIEVTELHRDPDIQPIPMQGREAVRDQVIEQAKKFYDRTGLPPVDCQVNLRDHALRKHEVEPLAKSIANLVAANASLTLGTHQYIEPFTAERFHPLTNVAYVRLATYEGLRESVFTGAGATWLRPLEVTHLKRIIDAKELNYPDYRRSCDEAYLVIVSDSNRMSTWFDGIERVRDIVFKTQFSRVFLLRSIAGRVDRTEDSLAIVSWRLFQGVYDDAHPQAPRRLSSAATPKLAFEPPRLSWRPVSVSQALAA